MISLGKHKIWGYEQSEQEISFFVEDSCLKWEKHVPFLSFQNLWFQSFQNKAIHFRKLATELYKTDVTLDKPLAALQCLSKPAEEAYNVLRSCLNVLYSYICETSSFSERTSQQGETSPPGRVQPRAVYILRVVCLAGRRHNPQDALHTLRFQMFRVLSLSTGKDRRA